jgi:hypothetical protein
VAWKRNASQSSSAIGLGFRAITKRSSIISRLLSGITKGRVTQIAAALTENAGDAETVW